MVNSHFHRKWEGGMTAMVILGSASFAALSNLIYSAVLLSNKEGQCTIWETTAGKEDVEQNFPITNMASAAAHLLWIMACFSSIMITSDDLSDDKRKEKGTGFLGIFLFMIFFGAIFNIIYNIVIVSRDYIVS